jgi:hypothetical protein
MGLSSPKTKERTVMSQKDRYTPKLQCEAPTEPFESVEEAWFWFIQAQQARNDGARITAGLGLVRRPCEPLDILRALDRLYRHRRLQMEHFLVLRHYGRRQMPPDPRRPREARACTLWAEALERLEAVLERKGIVRKPFLAHNACRNVIPFPEAAE